MMRQWNQTQEKIYKIYFKLGKNIKINSNNEILNNKGWEEITKQGIWKLPVKKEYGGSGLTWDECVIAIKALTRNYRNHEFFSSIVTHFAVLYIFLQYGTEKQKTSYLDRLLKGEVIDVCIKEYYLKSCRELNVFRRNKNNYLLIKKDSYQFNDFINFKKLLYGVIAIESMQYIIDDCRVLFKNSQSDIFNISINKKYQETKNLMQNNRKILYLLFSRFIGENEYKRYRGYVR